MLEFLKSGETLNYVRWQFAIRTQNFIQKQIYLRLLSEIDNNF
jgi:hypothetical protein